MEKKFEEEIAKANKNEIETLFYILKKYYCAFLQLQTKLVPTYLCSNIQKL